MSPNTTPIAPSTRPGAASVAGDRGLIADEDMGPVSSMYATTPRGGTGIAHRAQVARLPFGRTASTHCKEELANCHLCKVKGFLSLVPSVQRVAAACCADTLGAPRSKSRGRMRAGQAVACLRRCPFACVSVKMRAVDEYIVSRRSDIRCLPLLQAPDSPDCNNQSNA